MLMHYFKFRFVLLRLEMFQYKAMLPNENKLKVTVRINDQIKDNQSFAITICCCKLNHEIYNLLSVDIIK